MAARIRDSSVLLLSLLSLFLSFYLHFYHDKKERRPRRIVTPVRTPYFHLIIEIEVSWRSLCSKFFPRRDRTHVETSPRLTIFSSGPGAVRIFPASEISSSGQDCRVEETEDFYRVSRAVVRTNEPRCPIFISAISSTSLLGTRCFSKACHVGQVWLASSFAFELFLFSFLSLLCVCVCVCVCVCLYVCACVWLSREMEQILVSEIYWILEKIAGVIEKIVDCLNVESYKSV